MNHKLILAKAVSILLLETQLPEPNFDLRVFIDDKIERFKIGEKVADGTEFLRMKQLKEFINHLRRRQDGVKIDLQTKFRELDIICESDESIYNYIETSVNDALKENNINQAIVYLKNEFNQMLQMEEFKVAFNKFSFDLNQNKVKDFNKFIKDLKLELDNYIISDNQQHSAIITSFNLGTGDGVKEAVEAGIKDADGSGLLITPWQGLNRMMGGGMRRSQMGIIAALEHNNKSGFLLSLCLGVCYFNRGEDLLVDKNKKPAVVYISFENDGSKTIGDIYKVLKESVDGVLVTKNDIANLSVEVMTKYIMETTRVRGYEFLWFHVNANEWSYMDICNHIDRIIDMGYEIHLTAIDYLANLPLTGCQGTNQSLMMQDMFGRVRNFFIKRNICCITPHQLDAEARELHKQGTWTMPEEAAAGSMLAISKGITRELDFALYIQLYFDKNEEKYYQVVARGKHRTTIETPIKYRRFCMQFVTDGGLPWDLEKQDRSTSKPGQVRNQQTGECEDYF